MAGLADTVAELLSRTRAGALAAGVVGEGAVLRPMPDFGSNPGALRMGLHVPDGLTAKAPLVVVLHGCAQTAAGYAAGAGWITLADRHGFAVLCPEQVRANNVNLCFNWFEEADVRRGGGEAASIAQMVRRAVADLDLDGRRVFVTGLSAGGAMAAALLATYPELFAAGAIIAGLPYGAASGVNQALGAMRRIPDLSATAWGDKVRAAAPSPPRWPKVAIWHGDADTTVTPAAAEALARQWCDVHAVTRSAALPEASARHTQVAWSGPDGSVAVALHRIAGLGHGTPIAASGADACGTPAPWILEAGLSSTREIARSWGLLDDERRAAACDVPPPAQAPPGATTETRTVVADVGETIARALRGAGLMR